MIEEKKLDPNEGLDIFKREKSKRGNLKKGSTLSIMSFGGLAKKVNKAVGVG